MVNQTVTYLQMIQGFCDAYVKELTTYEYPILRVEMDYKSKKFFVGLFETSGVGGPMRVKYMTIELIDGITNYDDFKSWYFKNAFGRVRMITERERELEKLKMGTLIER